MGSTRDDDSLDPLERVLTPLRRPPSPPHRSRRAGSSSGRRRAESSSGELRPGTELQRYVILERLGRGGMGDVFLAYDPELDRRLALKVLRGESSDSSFEHGRLRREAQALAQLSHPNVVTVYDVAQWHNRTFIAMELVEGIHLGRWFRLRKPSRSEILRVFIAAGRGLAAAHAEGIIHRDFKPVNVMVGDDGRICVLDFGLATERDAIPSARAAKLPSSRDPTPPLALPSSRPLTSTGLTVGTPAYMAPEQHRGLELDARSDQFSFCVSLFEALVGQRPFPGDDAGRLLHAKDAHHLLTTPESSKLPPWLLAVIERGLSPRPDDRFPSMDALLVALKQGTSSRRYRWASLGLLVAGVGVAWAAGTPKPSPCQRAAGRVSRLWDDARAQRVRRAFSSTGLSYAETSFGRVVEQLDAYSADWTLSHQQTCEAAQARPSRVTDPLDLRLQCLERCFEQLEATIEVLGDADSDTVRRATRLVAALPSVGRCERVEAHQPESPLSVAPSIYREVEQLRGRLATAEVLNEAGRYRDGLRMSQSALDDALRLDYPPVQIEARRLVGQLLIASGDPSAAESPLTEAALAAQALPYEREAILAMIELTMLLGVHLARTEEARNWAEHTRAALRRAPAPQVEARLWAVEAAVAMAQGHYDQSRQQAEHSLELYTAALGTDHPDLVSSHNNLANALWRLGALAEADAHYARALEIAERTHGPDHPLIASLLLNKGGLLGQQGRLDQARRALERGLEIRRRALGERHPEVGSMLNNLGNVMWQQGHHEQALEMLREGLSIQERAFGPDDVKHIPALHNIAGLLLNAGDVNEARRHAQRALDLLERFRKPQHPRRIRTLTILGRIATHEGNLSLARSELERAFVLMEPLGDEHLLTAGPHEAMGELERAEGNLAAAARSFERAIELRESAGESDAAIASVLFSLASTRTDAGEPDERVRPLLERIERSGDVALQPQISQWRAAHDFAASASSSDEERTPPR